MPSRPMTWPDDEPALLPFLPMIYIAWADGHLSDEQMADIAGRLQATESLDGEAKAAVSRWLDAESPPSSEDLHRLMSVVRRRAPDLGEDERYSLAELGLALIPTGLTASARESTARALSDVEEALGIAGLEASREFLAPVHRPSQEVVTPSAPFDGEKLTALLDGSYCELRRRIRTLLQAPAFGYRYDLARAEYRELVLQWTQRLADEGLGALGVPQEYGGAGDYGAFIATFETLAHHDLSLVIKFGVQFGLFGGSVLFLGTEQHHKRYLRDIASLRLPGCFAMTELGHGSNVWDIETVARFDQQTGEFIIDTGSESARKEWIGNAALHGRMATVFAQLEMNEDRYGVHAFLVPLRNDAGRLLPGVRIEDCGEKEGLNGIDNGRIWFDAVRVPRENLLDRYGHVSEAGEYSSPIASPSKRFFTMLGTLVGGRVSVAAASLSAAKTGLAIAGRYVAERRQFGPAGQAEFPVLDYLTTQRRLMPRLAAAYALDFAQKYVTRRFLERTEEDAREVEAMAAGLKAFASWSTVDTLQVCREVCGGQGYLAVNRIPRLKADTDVFTTFEGDNTVLLQLVAKARLTSYQHQFGEMKLWGMVKLVADRAATVLSQLNPIVPRMTDEAHLRDPAFYSEAFRYREERLLATVARRLKRHFDEGADTFVAFNDCQDHLVALGNAWVERLVVDRLVTGVAEIDDDAIRTTLTLLRDLFALWRIEEGRGWFLENGYIEGNKAKAIRNLVTRLCREARDVAVPLVDAFGIPDHVLAAPIAFGIDPRGSTPAPE